MALIAGLALCLALLRDAGARRGALIGFLFGCGQFCIGFEWLLYCIQRFGGFPLWGALIVYGLIVAEVASFIAVFGAVAARFAGSGLGLALLAPAAWTTLEWARLSLFGWGWNLVGYAWVDWPLIVQAADLGGVYLLSWASVSAAGAIAAIGQRLRQRPASALAPLAHVIGLIALACAYGAIRLGPGVDVVAEDTNSLTIGIVQGNIPQERKWNPDFRSEIFQAYLDLTSQLPGDVDLVVWPESALPFYLQSADEERGSLADLVMETATPILLGADVFEQGPDGVTKYFNTAILFDETASLRNIYRKHHLIAFGEYIPAREFFPDFIQRFSATPADLSPGPGPGVMQFGSLRLGPLICFEVIFPNEVRALVNLGADVLINITNDAWFGESIKAQHLAMTKMRAIETRTPMVRVANTGISAVIDRWGNEILRIESDRRGAESVSIVPRKGDSLFLALGPWVVWVSALSLLLALLWRGGRARHD